MPRIHAPGATAPALTLHAAPDQTLSPGELQGKPVMLAFCPADWNPVCGDEMVLFNQVRPMFQKFGADVVGISVDRAWRHEAFAKHHHLHIPRLADFEPEGAVARAYGACHQAASLCERTLFVIDRHGTVAWRCCSPMAVNPGADGILAALEQLPD